MATDPEYTQRFKGLKIATRPDSLAVRSSHNASEDRLLTDGRHASRPARHHQAMASHESVCATPPMDIPAAIENAIAVESSQSSQEEESYMERFMRKRNTSISFSNEVTTDSGHRQSINAPLQKSSRKQTRDHRSNSESIRDHYDLVTGRHLPQFSHSPVREEPHVGEARFPLLQQTVDAMARESGSRTSQTMSLTTESTLSPTGDEVHTPRDEPSQHPFSPLTLSPQTKHVSTSLESPRAFRRTASERWRSGEQSQDFFSRAGSMRKGTGSWRNLRRDTASSVKTPNSAASSFLRAFSMGSGGDEPNTPVAVDAEGQTIGEDYVLGKQIGFGGFSIVREVTQLSSETGQQRKLAAKIVRRNIENRSESENEAAQAEFDHEVELWRFLSHDNILPLEAVYKLDEATFCFIPLNSGGTLFDVMRDNRQGLKVSLVRHYASQLAAALRYLHLDARVVHRDVKLENCLIDQGNDESGVLRLCDFGMAEWISNDGDSGAYSHEPMGGRLPPKAMGPADSSTAAFAGGSLEYAAPEIVQRATSSDDADPENNEVAAGRSIVSPAVDIWAFGVCLFTLLMGKRPFSHGFMPRVVMAILAGEWDADAVREKLSGQQGSEDILELLDGCLQKDVDERWSIGEVVDCAWFSAERSSHGQTDNDTGRAWRL